MTDIKVKVYKNMKNGQFWINIPKKQFEIIPREIELKVPKKFLKLRGKEW